MGQDLAEEKFNYVIARFWNIGDNRLCTYTYGSEVFYGTMWDALSMAIFVNRRADEKDYKAYKIDLTPIHLTDENNIKLANSD